MLPASDDSAAKRQVCGNDVPRKQRTRAGKMRLPTLNDLDQRTAAYRDATDLIERVLGERGGRDHVDIVRTASAETWAVLTTQIRALQVQWLNGDSIDWSEFTTIANARRREGELLGDPSPRDVTPDIYAIAREKAE